jgi:uncharacterized protein (DUF2141 family)
MKIDPVSFQYNGKLGLPTGQEHVGVIAQDIKEVAPYMVSKNDKGYYGYDANAMWYILVNSVKEQQKQLKKEKEANQSLNNKVEKLQKQVDQLASQVNSPEQSFKKEEGESTNRKTVTLEGDNEKQAMLLQNRPNPYSGETVIPYYLPENFDQARLIITNIQGAIIKQIPLENAGKGELTLRTNDLKAGQYQYSLIVDGREIGTRKMINNRK